MSRGSETAKKGFRMEKYIAEVLNYWKTNKLGSALLENMKIDLRVIESVKAARDLPRTAKPDLSVKVFLKNGKVIKHFISVKEAKKAFSFNHLYKAWVNSFSIEYGLPDQLRKVLKLYVGEISKNGVPLPDGHISGTEAKKRRLYLSNIADSEALVKFFQTNKKKIVRNLLLGYGDFEADYLLVVLEDETRSERLYVLVTDEQAVEFYGEGEVGLTSRGNLKIGRITLQRKGGNAGLSTANMLQFKISPASLLEKYYPFYVENF